MFRVFRENALFMVSFTKSQAFCGPGSHLILVIFLSQYTAAERTQESGKRLTVFNQGTQEIIHNGRCRHADTRNRV